MPKKKLLLVEDDLLVGERLLNKTLELKVLEKVQLTKNLKEAKDNLLAEKFDLIVLDLNLPDGNGIELLKWLNEKQIRAKVFIFSMNRELKRICLRNGAHAFFDKSNDFDTLISTIFSSSSNDDFSMN